MIETKKPSTRNSHTRRNTAILVTVLVIVVIAALAYYVYEETREKPEVLSPQERWIILDANYDEDEKYTSITFKYLGENRIEADIHTISYGHRGPILQDILFESKDLGTVRKGNVMTVKIEGYTYRLRISFRRDDRSQRNEAVLDVLPKEEFGG